MKSYSIEDILKMDAREHIKKCFKKYGIEGTESKIKEIMKGQAQEYMLERYREVLDE